jgi:CheY-like chemotaxis protein
MTKPLALISYEELLPGSQVSNRLQELGYRTRVVPSPASLLETARAEKPLVVLLDLRWSQGDVLGVIVALRKNSETQHVPLLAFTTLADPAVLAAARTAGATLVAKDDALLSQLPQLLDQVLAVE